LTFELPGYEGQIVIVIFTVLEFLSFSYFIYLNLKLPFLRRLILWTSATFILLPIIFYLTKGNLNFQSLIFSIENIIIIPFCVLYFYEQINKPDTFFIYLSKSFWIILGIIIYMTGTLFVFIYIDSLPPKEGEKYWIINLVFNSIKNILFAIGIYINKPKEQFNSYLESPDI
jgi:hypothetical protein